MVSSLRWESRPRQPGWGLEQAGQTAGCQDVLMEGGNRGGGW